MIKRYLYLLLPAVILIGCSDDPTNDIAKYDGFEMEIPSDSKEKLEVWKEIAIEQGIISSDLKEYTTANWIYYGDTIKIEIRLKGDWTDHLRNDLSSYRIKLPKDLAFRDLQTFSIQDPLTRNYAHEWFMHRLFDMEGMLTTTYEFVPALINGEAGVYAIEEHFESRLLTSRHRIASPILKIDESGLWAARLRGMTVELYYPVFPSSIIKPFKKSKILEDEKFKQRFELGANLVNLYKTNQFEASAIFDMKQCGQLFALYELGNITHALIWHNQRFYYNPITTKLEFIGFDMDPGHEGDSLILVRKEFKKSRTTAGYNLIWPFLCDKDFKDSYVSYLRQYSSEEFLDLIENELEDEIELSVGLLSANDPTFDFDLDFYRERAGIIRQNLKNLENEWMEFIKKLIRLILFTIKNMSR